MMIECFSAMEYRCISDLMTLSTYKNIKQSIHRHSSDRPGCKKDKKSNQRTHHTSKILIAVVLFLLALLIRTYHIHSTDAVIWDEAHFGKFARAYLRNSFYFDVHPPLGKMITAMIGHIANMPTDFEWKSASTYPGDFYITMRFLHAIIGSLIIPILYLSLLNFSISHNIAICISIFFIFENGLITISRLILLDSTLLLFTALTVFSYSRYFKIRLRNFKTSQIRSKLKEIECDKPKEASDDMAGSDLNLVKNMEIFNTNHENSGKNNQFPDISVEPSLKKLIKNKDEAYKNVFNSKRTADLHSFESVKNREPYDQTSNGYSVVPYKNRKSHVEYPRSDRYPKEKEEFSAKDTVKNEPHESFQKKAVTQYISTVPSLIFLGICLGCTLSVKWIGAFTIISIGFFIILEIIVNLLYADILYILKHFIKRAIFLIVLPLTVYTLFFIIHFQIAHKRSLEEGHVSSLYVHTMLSDEVDHENNKPLTEERLRWLVPYGNLITLKCTSGHYIHSHMDTYPIKESNVTYQQVTGYNGKDENNYFAFQRVSGANGIHENDQNLDFFDDFLKEGDQVVILHIPTKKYVLPIENERKNGYWLGAETPLYEKSVWTIKDVTQSVNVRSFNNHIANEIIQHGNSDITKANQNINKGEDHQNINHNGSQTNEGRDHEAPEDIQINTTKAPETTGHGKNIPNNPGHRATQLLNRCVKPITHSFLLYNQHLDCYLSSSGDTLPEWGHKQGEMVCMPWSEEQSKNKWLKWLNRDGPSRWNVEMNWFGLEEPSYDEIKKKEQHMDRKKVEYRNKSKNTGKPIETGENKAEREFKNTKEQNDLEGKIITGGHKDKIEINDQKKAPQDRDLIDNEMKNTPLPYHQNDVSSLLKSISYDLSDISLLSRIFIFIHCYIEINMSMYRVNNTFTIDPEIEPARISSQPWEWFILFRGLRLNAYIKTDGNDIKEGHKMFYMFGNPFSWYLSLICMFICFVKLNDILFRSSNYCMGDQLSILKYKNRYFMLYHENIYKIEKDHFVFYDKLLDEATCQKQFETIYRVNLNGLFSSNEIEKNIINSEIMRRNSKNGDIIAIGNTRSIKRKEGHKNNQEDGKENNIANRYSENKTNRSGKVQNGKIKDVRSLLFQPLTHLSLFIVISYLCHYLPFYFIKRVLYFHHYFPALTYQMISISIVLQFIGNKKRIFNYNNLIVILAAVQIGSFIMFRKCVYGFKEYSEMWDMLGNWDYIER